ncbi:YbhB/YbcL family Raf kinase inhibitor-like protein [Nitrosopumilus cobalaminigenes]|uniref:YbhB/YbcL family Raf kinase inhibitor-like protein n=1 Tax=Nitrosopumilus cobalaminigenes TaxID=1470066 RepID=A0A7D5QY99_9ARCH|nr:YbhB/YbcL family Raf kinase inhibitor-like protein [Nitrosopumilus cobalaminigenes]QLH02160.1 YbhB/YbcL family Raf kinase inhibitor-like protein [Nitrosopumilus cobalaminigenes]
MTFYLESKAFENGGTIPKKYGYKHGNISPHLKINNIPNNTVSLALIMDDPDAMGAVGKIWVHWVVWNIDPTNSEFIENSIPQNCIEGQTDFGENGYGGPAPPDKEHTYFFKLYALDQKLDIKNGSTKQEIESAMENHIIEETILKGKYAP